MPVTTNTVHEVWTTGAAANGGGFDATVAAPGTDYSQQAGSQKTYTDIVIDAVTNTDATSVLVPFVAADVGNVYNITAGTGFTVQRAVLMSVTGVIGRFNVSLGTLSSVGGLATMGGALGGAVTGAISQPAVVPGNVVYVKATATYNVTAVNTFSVAGTQGNTITMIGYTTTRTDGGMVTLSRTSNAFLMINATGGFRRFFNFICDANSGATNCFSASASNTWYGNCKAQEFTTTGFNVVTGNQSQFTNCYATAGVAGATAAFSMTGGALPGGIGYFSCVAAGNACSGFLSQAASTVARTTYSRCIAANNVGASTYNGFTSASTGQITLMNCVAYGNEGSGVLLDTTASATAGDGSVILNCVFANNTGFGISSNGVNLAASGNYQLVHNYNAFYNNTAGPRNQVPIGGNDITLTGDPFTDGAALDFSLNNTAGAGAALKAAGFPGVLQAGGTGYLDVGVLQHQDPAGGGGAAVLAGGGLGLVQTG